MAGGVGRPRIRVDSPFSMFILYMMYFGRGWSGCGVGKPQSHWRQPLERLSVVELRRQLAEVMNRTEYQGQRFVIQRRDKASVAIISIEDLNLLERLVRQEEDRIDVEAAQDARKEDDYIPYEDFRAEMGMTDERRKQPVPNRDRRSRPTSDRKVAKKGT